MAARGAGGEAWNAMRIRTVLVLLGGTIVVAVLLILHSANRAVLAQPIVVGHGVWIPVWLAFVLTAAFSALLPLLFGLVRDVRRMVADLSSRRRGKRTQEAERRYVQGVEAMLHGREERALAHFTAVLEAEPDHYDALLRAGEVLRLLRRPGEAIELHRRAMRLRENDPQPLYHLVADYEESGAVENAKAILNRIIDLQPKRSLNAYRKYRAICVNEENWEKAWEIQQKIEEQLGELGRPRGGEKKYHLGIRYMMAQRLADGDRPREAIGMLRRLVRMEPSFVPAHLSLGRSLLRVGQPEEAVEVWEEGYRSTGHPILLSSIEDHHLREEQPRRAIEALKAAVGRGGSDAIPRFFLGKLYSRLEMLDEALQQFALMKGKVTYFPALHYHLAKIMERHGNHREAIRELETVLQQAEVLRVEYVCGTCARKYPSWVDYCARCGEWNTVVVDFKEERPVEELGLSTAPVYTADLEEG